MSIIASGTTSGTALVSTGDTNGNLVFQTNGTTTALTLSTAQLATFAGKASFPSTIGVGGATASASGAGISFPSAISLSTDPNTLDDYEEGTWVPTVIGTTVAGTASYTVQTGVYTRIGQLVYVAARVDYSGGTGSGNLRISGLPFTSANNIQRPLSIEVGDIALGAGNYSVASVVSNNTQVSLASCPTGGAAAASTTYDAAGYIIFNGTYSV